MSVGRWLMTIGGLLQLAGIAVVFVEIGQTERLLRLRSWWRRTLSDLGRILSSLLQRLGLRRRRPVVVEVAGGALGVSGGTARVTVVPGEGTTVEERLDSHRRQLAALREELERVQQRLDQNQAEGRAALADVETRLRSEVASVRQLVNDLGGGFLRGRALGGGLILVGTLLITIGVWA
jgi:hypothetical protein